MIVRDIMTTRLVTVAPEDILGHACNLFRQYQFHHLPVVQTRVVADRSHHGDHVQRTIRLFEGVLTTQDIELAMARAQHNSSSQLIQHPWQEQYVAEVMNPSPLCVSPTTSVGAAAHLLVERGVSSLPVIEYREEKEQALTLLVGLLTRSDLLLALAHTYGAFEPGTPLDIVLPDGDMTPLMTVLHLAAELHVRSLVVAPSPDGIPRRATLSLGTIYPMPLLSRLQEAGVTSLSAHPLEEEQKSLTQQEVSSVSVFTFYPMYESFRIFTIKDKFRFT